MKKFSLVIADDALFMRKLLSKIIRDTEHLELVGEATNGYEAIEIAKQVQPDIMTLDLTMPTLNGLDAITDILIFSPKTKIIIISAIGQKSFILEAISRGAKDFIIKPFEKSKVLQSIKNVIAMN